MSQIEIISLALATVSRSIIAEEERITEMWNEVNAYEGDPAMTEYVTRLTEYFIPLAIDSKNLNIGRAEYLTNLADSIENMIL